MGIFSAIKDFIFSRRHEAPTVRQDTPPPVIAPTAIAPATTMATPLGSPALAPDLERVDVEAILDHEAAQNGQTLNWRTSIIDLMKLCGLDSSLDHRKTLAKELGYTGDTDDTAPMNIWLHKAVMKKLEDAGGEVPADLK